MATTYAAAFSFTASVFATHSDDTLVHEFDVDALAAQIEHLANTEGLDLEVVSGPEFWAIAEPYRW